VHSCASPSRNISVEDVIHANEASQNRESSSNGFVHVTTDSPVSSNSRRSTFEEKQLAGAHSPIVNDDKSSVPEASLLVELIPSLNADNPSLPPLTVVLSVLQGDVSAANRAWLNRQFEVELVDSALEIVTAYFTGVNSANANIPLPQRLRLLQAGFGALKVCLNNCVSPAHIHLRSRNELVIRSYNAAAQLLSSNGINIYSGNSVSSGVVPSVLLNNVESNASASVFCEFGGQGYSWLNELRELYSTYPYIRNFIHLAAEQLKAQANSLEAVQLGCLSQGFDLMAWITADSSSTTSIPTMSYLSSAPVSYPMICLLQLCHFQITLYLLQITPQQFLKQIKAMSGHSQGIISAVVAAASDSQERLIHNSVNALIYMLWHGCRIQQIYGPATVSSRIATASEKAGFGQPTPMLAVRGLDLAVLTREIAKTNALLPAKQQIYLSLVNARDMFVVAGAPSSLHEFRLTLQAISAAPGVNQDRVPYSQRKFELSATYLAVSAPFHTPLLLNAIPLILADCKRLKINLTAKDLLVPVFSTSSGNNLQESPDLIKDLISHQCVEPVAWHKICSNITNPANNINTVIDFGPNGLSGLNAIGAAVLTEKNIEGSGITIVCAGLIGGNKQILGKAALFEKDASKLPKPNNWTKLFAPKLVKKNNDGEYELVTKFTRLFGKPPVCVAGMTPSTVGNEFVSACAVAGYYVELAGGGQHSPQLFRSRIEKLTATLRPGDWLAVNLLFLNPFLWRFQFPLCLQLRSEGYPIDCITIAAGVPSADKADEFLGQMREAGISKIAFKPGSADAIRSVLAIAQRNPGTTVVVQWTGGRSGGHHSCEDQFQPLLSTYAAIREVENVVLIVGGGLGDSTSAYPWLSGEWSLRFGVPAMPVDALLIGSRVMVAKEAATHSLVKKLIAETPGVSDEDWERSFINSNPNAGSDMTGAGGIITVQSELGEPIHKVSNKGTRLWADLDNRFFTLPKDQLITTLAREHKWLVDAINASYQKPYFCRNLKGETLYYLRDMSYYEVAARLLHLSYVPRIDPSNTNLNKASAAPANASGSAEVKTNDYEWFDYPFQARWNEFVTRIVERFAQQPAATVSNAVELEDIETAPEQLNQDPYQSAYNVLNLVASNENPNAVLKQLQVLFPQSLSQKLQPEDELFFLQLCKKIGKPVNFIPTIDADLKFWFKKDSLWYCDDLRSVPDNDPQRVCILQGPVATKFSTQAEQPVKEILDEINLGMAKLLHQKQPNAVVEAKDLQKSFVPSRSVLQTLKQVYGKAISNTANVKVVLSVSEGTVLDSVDVNNWFTILLGGSNPSWRHALFNAKALRHNKTWFNNSIRASFAPRTGITVELAAQSNEDIDLIQLFDSTLIAMGLPASIPAIKITYDSSKNAVQFVLNHPIRGNEFSTLALNYSIIDSECSWASVSGVLLEQNFDERCSEVLNFYKSLWSSKDASNLSNGGLTSRVKVTADSIRNFRCSTGDLSSDNIAPVDLAIVIAWQPIVTALMQGSSNEYGAADLLSLVHLSNQYMLKQPQSGKFHAQLCNAGEEIQTAGQLLGVFDELEGQRVITVSATITNLTNNTEICDIISRFAIPLTRIATSAEQQKKLFRTVKSKWSLAITSDKILAVFNSKSWHKVQNRVAIGTNLVFELISRESLSSKKGKDKVKLIDSQTIGNILINNEVVEQLNITETAVLKCEVLAFLQRHAVNVYNSSSSAVSNVSKSPPQYYPVYNLSAPRSNVSYAMSSGDVNPIHTNPYVQELAFLPATIVHGMYSSACVRQIIERASNGPVQQYTAEFTGMVIPGVQLTCKTHLSHIQDGFKIVKAELRDEINNILVMKGTGYVAQANTAYLFTGQGSAAVGMGMELYNNSPASSMSRRVWDEAEQYLSEKYGFSILYIVKNNPKKLQIPLDGPNGALLRQNWANLTVENAEGKTVQLFPQALDSKTEFITFESPEGLLFQTQFQQPAILLQEKSAFEDMKSRGAIQSTACYAGHSLGEYGAVACLLSGISLAQLSEVVFLRGITMQSAVQRDSKGRSRYGMVAVAPNRVGKWMTDTVLDCLVNEINVQSKRLLQVVNFNVRGAQYVVAGELIALEALRLTLDTLRTSVTAKDTNPSASALQSSQSSTASAGNLKTLSSAAVSEQLRFQIQQAIQQSIEDAEGAAADINDSGFIPLRRGDATIPLQGIDVPFHSRLLLGGVATFRKVLERTFSQLTFSPEALIGVYIPNLLGIPFTLDESFAQAVFECTQSPIVNELLGDWENLISQPQSRSAVSRQMVIELLAYQFASPVQWVNTQHQLVTVKNVRRCIEIGPSAVLTNMLQKSFQALPANVQAHLVAQGGQFQFLFVNRDSDRDKIFYTEEGSKEAPEANIQAEQIDLVKNPARKPATAAPVAVVAAAAAEPMAVFAPAATPAASGPATSSGGSVSIALPAVYAIRIILSQKLKLAIAAVDPNKSVKALCAGKSALQNEVMGDLAAEFKAEPDGVEELPLLELANKLQGSYNQPGKVLTNLASKLVSAKLPGGYAATKVKQYYAANFGLDDASSNAALAHALTMAPENRFADNSAAEMWLDNVATSYAAAAGSSISKRGAVGPAGASSDSASSGAVAAVDPKAMQAIRQMFQQHADALTTYLHANKPILADAAEETDDLAAMKSILDAEHGSKYLTGIKGMFDAQKLRNYDSWWAWARQLAVEYINQLTSVECVPAYEACLGLPDIKVLETIVDLPSLAYLVALTAFPLPARVLARDLYLLINRATPDLLTLLKVQIVRKLTEMNSNELPAASTVSPAGYNSNAAAKATSGQGLPTKYLQFAKLFLSCSERVVESALTCPARYLEYRRPSLPVTTVNKQGKIQFSTRARYAAFPELKQTQGPYEISGFARYVDDLLNPHNANRITLANAIPLNDSTGNLDFVTPLQTAMTAMISEGLSLSGKIALITGAGAGSIGAAIVRNLLLAGCHVIVTTSSAKRATWELFQSRYQLYGSKSARLTVVPWNAASQSDVDALIKLLFNPIKEGGLAVGAPDYIIPFAAISENGRDISNIDEQSELAHRAMLTNVVRLIGGIYNKLQSNQLNGAVIPNSSQHSLVVLPLSPNHGLFGGDGLYSESKIGLHTLFAKWRSEGWAKFISLIGAEIGWTRGTGLMNSNDLIAESIEKECGLRTFDVTEMAFTITALLSKPIAKLAQIIPIKADLSGGFHRLGAKGLPAAELRNNLAKQAEINKAVYEDNLADSLSKNKEADVKSAPSAAQRPATRARLNLNFPSLPLTSSIPSSSLEGLLDLSQVIVCVGFGEVGPYGSSRTRWEYELNQQFSIEGSIELARSMGLIKFQSVAPPHPAVAHIGWVDAKTNAPLLDNEIFAKYGEYLLQHVGIRNIEPALHDNYDPSAKLIMRQLAVEADLPPFEVESAAEANHLKAKHGNHIELIHEGDRTIARIKKGAVIYVPKSVGFNRTVAAQIPAGWDPKVYGIPADICNSVDPVTLYALAATIDAFATAGISDPYELYSHCHVSEVGNSVGGGMGGMKSLRGIFRHRLTETQGLASDQLQESFINTTAAWINMLLLSSCGPIKTPVAACATAAISVELAVDSIKAGKAKVMICGGTEDFSEEGSFEFGAMGATSNSQVEFSQGYEAKQHCRPTTTTRHGFMEGHGAGIHILMTAEMALKLGCPIYSIVANAHSATDRQGRSVPAPGQGILSTAREINNLNNPLLDINWRKSEFDRECAVAQMWLEEKLQQQGKQKTGGAMSPLEESPDPAAQEAKHYSSGLSHQFLMSEYHRRLSAAQRYWGHDFYVSNPEISMMRGSLSIYGLTVNDLELVSCHGTGTVANDKNESEVVDKQLSHLGRSVGNPIYSVFQKWLTGHPKGSAAAWMFNGAMQSLLTGVVPGNRNADNIAEELRGYSNILYSNQTVHNNRALKAAYLHSFGFGQAGAQIILINPHYLYTAINKETYQKYCILRDEREQKVNLLWLESLTGQRIFIPVKFDAPYASKDQDSILLNPLARAQQIKTPSLQGFNIEYQMKAADKAAAVSISTGEKESPGLSRIPSKSSLFTGESTPTITPSASRMGLSSGFIAFASPPQQQAKQATAAALERNLRSLASQDQLSNSVSSYNLAQLQGQPFLTAEGRSFSGDIQAKPTEESKSPNSTMNNYGIGVDIEELASFESKEESFWQKNYTAREIEYCKQAAHPISSFVGRWCAKEAVIKAISSLAAGTNNQAQWRGSSSALRDIEILISSAGAPMVRLSGEAAQIAANLGVDQADIRLSIAHSEAQCIAQALAFKHSRSTNQATAATSNNSTNLTLPAGSIIAALEKKAKSI
jgi:fatty acid synthase subunit alpha